ncbi:MAG: hypothetical protein SGI73_08645 [Chloroflexota bacterium]|nr:hypothetical protein [Chloroflexota bacterium]
MANILNEEQVQTLRTLANRWMMLARDYDRDSKNPKIDADKAAYQRGLSEAFRKSALELANVLKAVGVSETGEFNVLAAEDAPTLQGGSPVVTAISFVVIDQTEAIRFLNFVGATPRDVVIRKDNSILAVFSKMQPLSDPERVGLIKNGDKRIMIITSGRTTESRDPYVEFGFRA